MYIGSSVCLFFFFFNDTATTEIYTLTHSFPTRRSSDLALHADRVVDAAHELDVSLLRLARAVADPQHVGRAVVPLAGQAVGAGQRLLVPQQQRLEIGRAHV